MGVGVVTIHSAGGSIVSFGYCGRVVTNHWACSGTTHLKHTSGALQSVNLDVRTMVSPMFWTNLLMKVQCNTESEKNVDNSCVSLTMVWTWNFVLSLGKRDGICIMA